MRNTNLVLSNRMAAASVIECPSVDSVVTALITTIARDLCEVYSVQLATAEFWVEQSVLRIGRRSGK